MLQSAASMTPLQFIAKWSNVGLKESAGYQEHFTDLCRMLGQPTPAEADSQGAWFTFQKSVTKTTGKQGFADVWMQGHFAWEYKGNHKDLNDAYQQLLQYREALENPPLLVVSDYERFEIHTNFTNTPSRVYPFYLPDLDHEENLAVLRALFTDFERLRPGRTIQAVTEQAAGRFGKLAIALQDRGVEPHKAAHFLVQVLFCLFAEDVGLLPNKVFSRLLAFVKQYPNLFSSKVEELFIAMRDGGFAGYEEIVHFNGGLFAHIEVIPLTPEEIAELAAAAQLDWANIEPAIIGTLFERSLDPARRSQLGTHYTGRADIERVVEPVVVEPLRRRWHEVRIKADRRKQEWEETQPEISAARGRRAISLARRKAENARQAFATSLFAFQEELAQVKILDPACGSGNFLYVALAKLKDLEKEIVAYGTANGLPKMFPRVMPTQLHGLEVNAYARELTQVVIWIGYLQWMTANGFQVNRNPVLEPLETIRFQDALLDHSNPAELREASWPEADFIIGNPPFLGDKRLRTELGDDYVDDLFRVYSGRIPSGADLVCYFFERARTEIGNERAKRAGLLATNSIRGGANREVLARIKETGGIFMAWPDEPWMLDGASVRISIVGFDDGQEQDHTFNGVPVVEIFTDLTAKTDLAAARPLKENGGIVFQGVVRSGPFDIPGELARQMLAMPLNPNSRPNADVIRPTANGHDVVRRPRDIWIIDFGVDMSEQEAALYEAPFEHVYQHVRPVRLASRSQLRNLPWWLALWPRPLMRQAFQPLTRFVATPRVARHRIFVWMDKRVLPDDALAVFARDDDYFFGVLHSRMHEIWSLRMGTWLGVGNDPRYTPTTCFETFPFPQPTDEQREAIAAAARELNERREAWLNPPDISEADQKNRTLTNLYNARPTWLAQAHEQLDRAVFAAYGWDDLDPSAPDEDAILARLLALNLERAGRSPET